MDDRALIEFCDLATKSSVFVASCDSDRRPHLTRGWGPAFDPEAGCLELSIATSDCPEVAADLAANGAVAVSFASPANYKSMQAKGTVEWIGEPTDRAHERIQAHIDAFSAEVAAVGLPPEAVTAIFGSGLVAMRIRVAAVFEQTPGPSAGKAL